MTTTLSNRLKNYRIAHELTVEELAKKLCIKKDRLMMIEIGVIEPKHNERLKIEKLWKIKSYTQ